MFGCERNNLNTDNTNIYDANKNAYKSVGVGAGVETVLNAHIKGVHGTLAQLVDIEDEYVDAINVALGSRAYSIVTDSQDVSWRAIQLLKSQGRDRASFMSLDIKFHSSSNSK